MPATSPQLMAGGDIYPSRFVRISASADNKGTQCGANELPIGVSGVGTNVAPLNDLVTDAKHATSGQNIRLHGDGEECLVEAAEAITRGARVKSDADGKAVNAATTGTTPQNVGGIAQDSVSGAGEMLKIQVLIGSHSPQ
mgnify:CR=1 FL=1